MTEEYPCWLQVCRTWSLPRVNCSSRLRLRALGSERCIPLSARLLCGPLCYLLKPCTAANRDKRRPYVLANGQAQKSPLDSAADPPHLPSKPLARLMILQRRYIVPSIPRCGQTQHHTVIGALGQDRTGVALLDWRPNLPSSVALTTASCCDADLQRHAVLQTTDRVLVSNIILAAALCMVSTFAVCSTVCLCILAASLLPSSHVHSSPTLHRGYLQIAHLARAHKRPVTTVVDKSRESQRKSAAVFLRQLRRVPG